MTARDKFIVVALLTLMVVVSVVTIAMDTREARVVPAYGGTYVEGVTGVPQYLNPVIAATDVDQDIARLVFSGLTRFDRDGAIVADLASTFRTETEGKVWTFEIRPDAMWNAGQDVTADDVVYTVKLLQDRAYVGPYADAFRGVTVERVGAKTVRFTLPDVYGPFAASTTVPILPSHILGGVPYGELARQQFNVRPDHAVFRDRAVRQAIVTAIDRGRILQLATDGRGTVADEFVPPTSWAYVKDVRKYTYSVEDAKRLLEDADWKDRAGDGIRE